MNTPQAQPGEDPQTTRARARLGMVLQEKWRLDSLLGVGGMAAVYAATHRNGKRVAVKMLHGELSHDEEVKRRFLQEGYAANTIQHDGAVSVLDDDVAPDGSAFIVMELLEGETVEARWERSGQRLPPREVLAIVDQLLDVLAAAHAKNVVHRDIKPENLFITRGGALKVLDFGIAKVFEATQARSTSTRAGTVMGTPAFMAPEQARARWDEVDGRTDLWAVGATMFTLLSGRHVHEGVSGNEQFILSATTPAQSLGRVTQGVPPAVVAIVDGALAFERERRWPNATAMQQAVQAALDALGGAEPVAPSGRRPATSTVLSGGVARGQGPPTAAHPAAATMIDVTGSTTASTAWAQEREMRLAEATRLRASIADLQQRHGAARKQVAEAQAKAEAGRGERTSLEQWFKRQVGTRTAAVEEARKGMRGKMVETARRAIGDRAVFGAELDPAREQIAKLEGASASAARDVEVHTAALESYDQRSLRLGVLLMGVAAALLLALVVVPIVWRATRVVEPPIPGLTEPATTR
ncbi:MAG TPA: protein kinase [Polyangiaceae bacterium]|jgi:serine/threonine-protein kinase